MPAAHAVNLRKPGASVKQKKRQGRVLGCGSTLAETTLILGVKKILEPARFTISWASSKIVVEDY